MAFKYVLVLISFAAVAFAVDYCKLCANHVGCHNNGKPAPNCKKVVTLSDAQKQKILEIHNKLRNQQANGETPGYEPAARMGTMQWDDDLAKMAHFNAASCKYGHDKCRNLPGWDNVGQNIAMKYFNDAYPEPDDVIETQVSGWFTEFKNCDMSLIKSYNNNGKAIGHFTQMVRESADRVGCAISQFRADGHDNTYIVCDYAMTNNFFTSIYEPGQAASKCKTGPNPKYPALCSESEEYEHTTPVFQLGPDGQLPPGFSLPPGVQIQYA